MRARFAGIVFSLFKKLPEVLWILSKISKNCFICTMVNWHENFTLTLSYVWYFCRYVYRQTKKPERACKKNVHVLVSDFEMGAERILLDVNRRK